MVSVAPARPSLCFVLLASVINVVFPELALAEEGAAFCACLLFSVLFYVLTCGPAECDIAPAFPVFTVRA